MVANASPESGDCGRDTATEEGLVRVKCMVSCFLKEWMNGWLRKVPLLLGVFLDEVGNAHRATE